MDQPISSPSKVFLMWERLKSETGSQALWRPAPHQTGFILFDVNHRSSIGSVEASHHFGQLLTRDRLSHPRHSQRFFGQVRCERKARVEPYAETISGRLILGRNGLPQNPWAAATDISAVLRPN
jgi:hypothetical protein